MTNWTGEQGIAAAIIGIGTALPRHRLEQEDVSARLTSALGERSDAGRWTRKLFRQSGVETRYTCEPNLLEASDRSRYIHPSGPSATPATAERMMLYRQEAVPLAARAADAALGDAAVSAQQVTHLMAVSCTGMFLPGLDTRLIEELGLRADVIRQPLTFLGCAAGLTAIRMAADIVRGDPKAVVLVACVELCTLHIQSSGDRESLYAAAFFGDGASACVISRTEAGRTPCFELGEGEATIFPDTADEMVWTIGDHGFDLYLSPRIPKLIGERVPPVLRDRFGPLLQDPKTLWAVHPGGRGIVDAVQSAFRLEDGQMAPSRSVLRRFGNLSSATIIYVLEEMRRELTANNATRREGLALAFGPGVSAELVPIAYVPVARPVQAAALVGQGSISHD